VGKNGVVARRKGRKIKHTNFGVGRGYDQLFKACVATWICEISGEVREAVQEFLLNLFINRVGVMAVVGTKSFADKSSELSLVHGGAPEANDGEAVL